MTLNCLYAQDDTDQIHCTSMDTYASCSTISLNYFRRANCFYQKNLPLYRIIYLLTRLISNIYLDQYFGGSDRGKKARLVGVQFHMVVEPNLPIHTKFFSK